MTFGNWLFLGSDKESILETQKTLSQHLLLERPKRLSVVRRRETPYIVFPQRKSKEILTFHLKNWTCTYI